MHQKLFRRETEYFFLKCLTNTGDIAVVSMIMFKNFTDIAGSIKFSEGVNNCSALRMKGNCNQYH